MTAERPNRVNSYYKLTVLISQAVFYSFQIKLFTTFVYTLRLLLRSSA